VRRAAWSGGVTGDLELQCSELAFEPGKPFLDGG
jgi:hypothetical protein